MGKTIIAVDVPMSKTDERVEPLMKTITAFAGKDGQGDDNQTTNADPAEL